MRPENWFQAVFFIIAGALLVCLCGLCTLDLLTSPGGASLAPIAFFVGGAPILAGGFLVYRGAAYLRRPRS